MSTPDRYKKAVLTDEEMAEGVTPLFDIFTYVHSDQKYVLFVAHGEKLTKHKAESLRSLNQNNLFVGYDVELLSESGALIAAKKKIAEIDRKSAFNRDVLGDTAGTNLKDAYRELFTPSDGTVAKVTRQITDMTDALLAVVAPDVEDQRKKILESLGNLSIMNHSAAIASLAVLVALSNDFKSKTAFQSLTQAALLMDASLGELEEHELETYYRNRRELPSHVMTKIKNHPVKSQQMVAYLPIANDTINQLILMHQELHNGTGYHRSIHTGASPALVKIICLAVDIYEFLKGAELRGETSGLREILLYLEEKNLEPHQRRHATKFVTAVIDYLGFRKK